MRVGRLDVVVVVLVVEAEVVRVVQLAVALLLWLWRVLGRWCWWSREVKVRVTWLLWLSLFVAWMGQFGLLSFELYGDCPFRTQCDRRARWDVDAGPVHCDARVCGRWLRLLQWV